MSLSEYEKKQFERITAGLDFGEPVTLKKMAKRDRATTMGYFQLPNIKIAWGSEAFTMVMVCLGFMSVPVAFLFLLLADNFGAAMASLFVGGLLIAVADAGSGSRNGKRRNI